MDAALLDHLEKLADSGKRLNHTELWILDKCSQKHYTISELAQLRQVSYQAIQKSVKKLTKFQLLEVAFQLGREIYYKCRVDLSETADATYRIKWDKESLTIAEFVGVLLSNDQNPLIVESKLVAGAIIMLYDRSRKKFSEDEDVRKLYTPQPPGPELRSMLINISDHFLEFSNVIRHLAEFPFYGTGEVHEWIGELPNEDLVRFSSGTLFNSWNQHYSVKGWINRKKLKEIGRLLWETWKPKNT